MPKFAAAVAECFGPHVRAGAGPAVGDRVADEQQVDIADSGGVDEALVPQLVEIITTGHRRDRVVAVGARLRRLDIALRVAADEPRQQQAGHDAAMSRVAIVHAAKFIAAAKLSQASKGHADIHPVYSFDWRPPWQVSHRPFS